MDADRGIRRAWRSPRLRWPALVLLIATATIVSYLLLGERIEASAHEALDLAATRRWSVAMLVVALLAADIVLPVPSSVVGAFAGAALGTALGTAAVWTGLMLGCVLGYWLGRLVPSLPNSGPDGANPRTRALGDAGPLMIAATRAVPILAETGIISAGAARMSFGAMLLVTAPANLLVALAYAGAGALLASFDPALVAMLSTILLAAAWGLVLLVRSKGTMGDRERSRAVGRP
jgi:uncharacterized membrane protein YdjX (TVP38/TMEM64 family)